MMVSQGTIPSAKPLNGSNSFDGNGTLELVEKTFDANGSYFGKNSVGGKTGSLKNSLTSCST